MVLINEENSTGLDQVKRFAKQMLKNSIFMGTFHEKRFVECLNGYRDVVSISEKETEFIQNLMHVKRKVERELIKLAWIGITGPDIIGSPVGYNVWVELPIEVFGMYWFKVKNIEFNNDQVYLKLDPIRPVKNECSSGNMLISNYDGKDLNLNISDIQIWIKDTLYKFYTNVLTKENMKTAVIFVSVFVSTLVLGSVEILKYLLEYLLRLLQELSKVIQNFTPIIINLINLCGKTIFGLFHLIVILFKRNPPPQPIYNAYVNYDPINGMSNKVFLDKGFQRALPSIQQRS